MCKKMYDKKTNIYDIISRNVLIGLKIWKI